MLNSQIIECLMSQALVWIAEHFPDCQPDEVPIYQEVYVNRILIAVSDQL
ncbi:MAG: hypothetical protein HC924_15820 [Synechococcaceae cyanobacterium SM2_3_2]|nr:hypothetical protein [Synechococcaceae cyanobacterium SM2_3_2]